MQFGFLHSCLQCRGSAAFFSQWENESSYFYMSLDSMGFFLMVSGLCKSFLATTPRAKTIAHFLCQQHTWPWYTWDASSLAVLLSSLPFKTQWALNGALKLPNQQKLRADGCLLFQEQNNQAKPYEIYCMLCFYLLLNALQSWKEEVDGREEKGRGTFTLEHTGREMVQCWCNSALRRYS